MTRWLVRFGYDGAPFAGWARQPGLRTVEGDILAGIPRCGIASSAASADLRVSSRTDRGVNARGNALTLRSELPGPALLRALNGIASEIVFTDAVGVGEEFRVRAARCREYRYFLPSHLDGMARWPSLFPHFLGRPIDVRSFARGVPQDRPCWRSLESLDLVDVEGGPVLRIRASGFLWGMVRKIVQGLELVGSGRVPAPDLAAALAGHRRLALPLAPAKGLVLWDVEFGIPWAYSSRARTHAQQLHFEGAAREAEVRARFVPHLVPAAPGPVSSPSRR